MRRQGREERNPMTQYPQANKLGKVMFLSPSVRSTLKSHWQIRGMKGLWRYQASCVPDSEEVQPDEIIAWFFSQYSTSTSTVNYGRFYRDVELEDAVKRVI